MESNQYFSMFILAVCAIHLAATIGARMQSWWQASAVGRRFSSKPLVRAVQGGGSYVKTEKKQRSDWYVFFHCADLIGKEPSPKSELLSRQERLLRQPQRQPSGKRPESRLTLS